MPGYPDYDERMHLQLQALNLALPFEYEGTGSVEHLDVVAVWSREFLDILRHLITPITSTLQWRHHFCSIHCCSLRCFASHSCYRIALHCIVGHYCDELRSYTHERLTRPGLCDCYNCQAKIYEFDKHEEIWERKCIDINPYQNKFASDLVLMLPWCIKSHFQALHCIVFHSAALHRTLLFCTTSQFTAWHLIVHLYIALPCLVLHYIIL